MKKGSKKIKLTAFGFFERSIILVPEKGELVGKCLHLNTFGSTREINDIKIYELCFYYVFDKKENRIRAYLHCIK